jgi:ribosome-associated protein
VSRSSGPGGQNVNKVNTRVTVRFDLNHCTDLSQADKGRIRRKCATRCSQDGMIRVTSQKYRTQKENRDAALQRLHELINTALVRPRRRIKTKPTVASQQRRLEQKKQRGQLKRQRSLRHRPE